MGAILVRIANFTSGTLDLVRKLSWRRRVENLNSANIIRVPVIDRSYINSQLNVDTPLVIREILPSPNSNGFKKPTTPIRKNERKRKRLSVDLKLSASQANMQHLHFTRSGRVYGAVKN